MKILQEISHQSSILTFRSLMIEMLQVMREANAIAKRNYEQSGDMKVAKRLLSSTQARWFSKNGAQLVSTARSLKQLSAAFRDIADFSFEAWKRDSEHAHEEMSKSAGFNRVLNNFDQICDVIDAPRLKEQMKEMLRERDNMFGESKLKDLPTTKQKKDQEEGNQLLGHQQQQVEKIVNDIIKSLPSDKQHEARKIVGRAGNKIVALQKFLKDNKL